MSKNDVTIESTDQALARIDRLIEQVRTDRETALTEHLRRMTAIDERALRLYVERATVRQWAEKLTERPLGDVLGRKTGTDMGKQDRGV